MGGKFRQIAMGGLVTMAPLSWWGCGQCYDCGKCGFVGGPNLENVMHYSAVVDDKDRLLASISVGAKGECTTPHHFWLDVSGTIAPAPANAKASHERATSSGDGRYVFELQSVTMTRVGPASVAVKFGDTGMTRTCSTADGLTVACK